MKQGLQRFFSIVLCAVMLMGGMTLVTEAKDLPKDTQETRTTHTPVPVTLDGKRILSDRAYLIDSVTYVGLRAFCEAVGGISVTWQAQTRTAVMTRAGVKSTAQDGAWYIQSNGRYFYTAAPIRIIQDTMYVPVRPLAKAYGVTVTWDAASRSVALTRTGKLPASGSSYYNQNDVYWLSRIIHAEAAGEPFLGKLAVGNVIINRKNSSSYPNTIYGVIFDRRHGVQFSPILNGSIYKTPNEQSVIAAKIALEGYTLSDSILFFMNPKIATNFWISQNRPFAFRIGNHYFYR